MPTYHGLVPSLTTAEATCTPSMSSEDDLSKHFTDMSLNGRGTGSSYGQVSSGEASRQHNGDVLGGVTGYVVGDIHHNHAAPLPRTADPRMDSNKANEKLLLAAANGHIDQMRYLIHDCNADRNYSDANGLTAVHWAALSGYEDVLEGLIRDGADVDELSAKFGTPLCLAALKGHKHIVNVLLTRRASPIIDENRLGSAIHCAAWGGDSSILELILDHAHKMAGSSQIYFDVELPGGRTADFEAAEALAKAIAGLRIRGKDSNGQQIGRKALQEVKQTTYSHCTPLSVAASGGKADTVSWLLSQGADANAASRGTRSSTSTLGLTPLSAAAQSGFPKVVQLLVDHGAHLQWPDASGAMALRALLDSHCASASALPDQDYAACAQIVLSLGADSSVLDHDERRALARLLPDHGIDTSDSTWAYGDHVAHQSGCDVDDEDLQDSLYAAAKKGRTELVTELIQRGAKLNEYDEDGRTTLMHAIDNGHIDTAEAILEEATLKAGGDFDIDDTDFLGDTAVSLACDSGNVDLVQLLLRRGASPNIVFLATEGPLFIAARSGDDDIASVLLEYGANVDEELDDGLQDGRAPLHEAAEYGEVKIVELLLAAGAKCDALDADGRSPLSYAVEYGMKNTVETLLSAGADAYAAAEDPGTISSFQQRNALGWIQEHGNISGLASAVAFGELEILQLFQRAGIDLQHYALGMPMLHLAIVCGKFEVAQYLINQGADVHTRGDQGQTAFDLTQSLNDKDAGPIKDLLLLEMARRPQSQPHVQTYHFQNDTQAWPGGACQSSPVPSPHVLGKVVVKLPFLPWSSEQLELQTGDHVSLTEELANEWWRGISDRTGLQGIFPESNVEYIEAVNTASATHTEERPQTLQHAFTSPLPSTMYHLPRSTTSIAQAVVVYPYVKTYPTTLGLSTGDCIDIIEYVDQIWWKGRSSTSGEEGMFPCSHVQLVDPAIPNEASAGVYRHW